LSFLDLKVKPRKRLTFTSRMFIFSFTHADPIAALAVMTLPAKSEPARSRPAAVGGTIRSLRRGLQVLDVIAEHGGRLALTEIARRLGLHFSTTHHMVKTLQTSGYVIQDDASREYRLGGRLLRLAAVACNEDEIGHLGEPLVSELTLKTALTSQLAVLDCHNVVVIRQIDADGPWRLAERVGTPRPAYCTALGKVLLANQTPEGLQAYLARTELRPLTPRSITGAAELQAEVARVRALGLGVDDEEFSVGIRCVAAPVMNFTGNVRAALGVSGPAWSLTLERLQELAPLVREYAERLSRQLGWQSVRRARGGNGARPRKHKAPTAGRPGARRRS
jgi:DNA-binding IclR family transcriptional regulator